MELALVSGDQPSDKDNWDNGRLARKRQLIVLRNTPKSPKLRVEFITSSQEARIAQQPIATVIPQHTSSSCAPPPLMDPSELNFTQPSFDGVHTRLVKDCNLRVPLALVEFACNQSCNVRKNTNVAYGEVYCVNTFEG
ncbi:hypothetical protein GOBAR_DD15276 [Gossypium barbadense]|nr:hypothetical protein GOBAR_DD15276 [Gossypium barbadense]